jgi:hypothetical protein
MQIGRITWDEIEEQTTVGRSELGYLAVVTSVGATNLIPPARTHNKEPSGGSVLETYSTGPSSDAGNAQMGHTPALAESWPISPMKWSTLGLKWSTLGRHPGLMPSTAS